MALIDSEAHVDGTPRATALDRKADDDASSRQDAPYQTNFHIDDFAARSMKLLTRAACQDDLSEPLIPEPAACHDSAFRARSAPKPTPSTAGSSRRSVSATPAATAEARPARRPDAPRSFDGDGHEACSYYAEARSLQADEIPTLLEDYSRAAGNALEAGSTEFRSTLPTAISTMLQLQE